MSQDAESLINLMLLTTGYGVLGNKELQNSHWGQKKCNFYACCLDKIHASGKWGLWYATRRSSWLGDSPYYVVRISKAREYKLLSTAFQSHIQLVLCSAFPSQTSFLVPPTLEGFVERPLPKSLEKKEKGYLWTVLMGSGVGMELLRALLKCFFQHFPVSNSVLCLYKSHLLGKEPSVFIHT